MPANVMVPAPRRGQAYQAPRMRLGRSQFDLSHQHKTTFEVGNLIPYMIMEVVPGDTVTCKLMAFSRIFSPLDAPVMDNIEILIDFFYVPVRLIWNNWHAFLGAHDAPGAQDVTYTMPTLAVGLTVSASNIYSYAGLPIGLSTTAESVNALPFRAYNLIWNDWYRDQNIQSEQSVLKDDGPDATATYFLKKTAKRHDYFTSALPYLQKGTAQTVALSDAPIEHAGQAGQVVGVYVPGHGSGADYYQIDTGAATADISATSTTSAFRLYADLSNVGLTINAIREAAAIQRLLERDARAGTRPTELIRAHFGVDVPDYRVQRSEYLGGGRGYINVSPVANTTAIDSVNDPASVDRYPGELAGVGTGTLRASWAKSFVEHGYVLGLLRARGEVSYQQGLDRMWSRSTKYDWLWPELAMLGEQEILNKELWIAGDATDDNVFGYQERYADWRFKKSLITGKFNSDATGSIDYWHLAEDFGSQPALNNAFIEDATPMSRITVVDSEPDFIIDGRFDLRVARPLPVRPVPTLAPARF